MNQLKIAEREKRVRDYVLPSRVMLAEGNIFNTETLLRQKPLQIFLTEPDVFTVNGRGSVVLDFGREIQGGIRVLTHRCDSRDTRVRIRFGESASETCAELICNGGTATNDHALRDFETNLINLSDMQWGNTGFRFVRIDFLSGSQEIGIKNIYGVYEHRGLERKGAFGCSDSLINEIFDVSAYTVELCMQGMLWDGIKRDRLVWIGDTHPEAMSIMRLFGADESVETALTASREVTPLPAFMNGMPAYSLWWLAILADYYWHTGDMAYLEREKPYATELVKYIDSLVGADGRLNFNSYFLDWPTYDVPEREQGVHALCSYAMRKIKGVYAALGLDCAVPDGILQRIRKGQGGGSFKQVNALRALAGHVPAAAVLPLQLAGGARGMSTFMSYYILASIAEAGETAGALSILKEYYGAMLGAGATTFFEDFDINWLNGSGRIDEFTPAGKKDLHGDFGAYCYVGFRHSLCHGWSSGPVPFLMRYVLGVSELEPGCKVLKIAPCLAGLAFAEGQYPTPFGSVKIRHELINGKVKSEVSAPAQIKIQMAKDE